MSIIDAVALKRVVVDAARRAGADSVRVTTAEPDAPADRRMRESFARGDLQTWGYDDAYARQATDPERALAGARSVVCCAFAYATPTPAERTPLLGRVSNYAWSTDYHPRIRNALQIVAAAIDRAAGAAVTSFACDTRPLNERAFAARAGLGWIGKHTNLIAPRLGSFVFLGEVFSTLEITPDPPLRTSCGACTRCVSACPTGALRGDYTIDARRCISDLTQRTDGIPRELRPLVGQWIWGCDLCQDVCPPTKLAGATGDDEARPVDPATAQPSLTKLLGLRSSEFKRRYRKTGMGWRGAAVLRRNAAVALGNALDRSAVSPLVRALERDAHPMVRGHAAWALGRIGAPLAVSALRRRNSLETDIGVREEIDAALCACEARVRSTE
ncbi:MAG TPA: tRNA epoxyqueuosine(34) reductase QueG [Candidatus Tumulicola sp.]|jgi:epoxyqueuosine reductase